MAITKIRFDKAGYVSAPIDCKIVWTPDDAGYPHKDVAQIANDWKSKTCRPCGLYHAIVDKKWCAYRCKYGTMKAE